MVYSIFPQNVESILTSAQINDFLPPSSKKMGRIIVLGKKNRIPLARLLKLELYSWQLGELATLVRLEAPQGPHWIVNLWLEPRLKPSPQDVNDVSHYSIARDYLGRTYASALFEKCQVVEVSFVDCSSEQVFGGLVGLEMGRYKYKDFLKLKSNGVHLCLNKLKGRITQREVTKASALGVAVNMTRHLVNTPPSRLNPQTYASTVRSIFQNREGLQLEVWKENRLQKEGMGLLLGVGQGAEYKSCMIHMKYRPSGAKGKPVAFVGKGITFDTGGLDLKPSAGMRLMKKDMGGGCRCYWIGPLGLPRWN